MAIMKARELKNLTWDELLGILRVHEIHLQDHDQKVASTSSNKGLQSMAKQVHVK